MAFIQKTKNRVFVYAERTLPTHLVINQKKSSKSITFDGFSKEYVEIDKYYIEESIEEAKSLTRCLERALLAQKNAENNNKHERKIK